jgi:hypothetical protein
MTLGAWIIKHFVERTEQGKHSSFLSTFVNYRRKKIHNIGPWDL